MDIVQYYVFLLKSLIADIMSSFWRKIFSIRYIRNNIFIYIYVLPENVWIFEKNMYQICKTTKRHINVSFQIKIFSSANIFWDLRCNRSREIHVKGEMNAHYNNIENREERITNSDENEFWWCDLFMFQDKHLFQ